MRLTLRTLLAYLDDTLPAAEIKGIGQKVAESDAAQELVARIKQVTRRRRLTTPPATGPNARFDANDVSEYLDNELPADKVAELEKVCLESDAHLAEISACHQILTLVLGEPALVPPTAKERMYGLVQGREAIPFRKAPAPATAAAGASSEEDEDLLGLPFLRRGPWLRWALPVAGVLLFAALGLAVWQALPDRRPVTPPIANSGNKDVATDNTTPPEAPNDKKDQEKPGPGKDNKVEPIIPKPEEKEPKEKKPEEKDTKVERISPPSTARGDAGFYVGGGASPSLLVARQDGKEWQPVPVNGRVKTTDALVSLPGYSSEVVTKKEGGVGLLLRGLVPEYALPESEMMTYLLESAVVLHKSEASGVDLDMTLLRGRIYLRNRNREKAVKVRLRFEKTEGWDLTMQQGTEVGIDLFRVYARDVKWREGEEPRAMLYLFTLRGEADVKVDGFHRHYLEQPPGAAMLAWDNFTRTDDPVRFSKVPPVWSKLPPPPRAEGPDLVAPMTRALRGLQDRVGAMKALDVALRECQESEKVSDRVLALYCYKGMNEVGKLLSALGDDDPTHAPDRQTAIFCLRRWLTRGAEQRKVLYDQNEKTKMKTGALIDAKYRPPQAQTILEMLFDFPDADRRSPETFELLASRLADRKVAVAELAYYHLLRLSFPEKIPGFNAGLSFEERERVAAQVSKLIETHKLPPAPPRPKMKVDEPDR